MTTTTPTTALAGLDLDKLEQQLRAAANRPTMPGREPGSILVHASLLRIAADAIAASRRAAPASAGQAAPASLSDVGMTRELEKLRTAYLAFMRTPSPVNYDAMLEAMPAALAAQPAEGAGQAGQVARHEPVRMTDEEIDIIWQTMPGGPGAWLKGFGYSQFAKAIEDEVILNHQRAAAPADLTGAARDVLAERRRQVEQEGWMPEHDDQYDEAELSRAAAAYALQGEHDFGPPPEWPWSREWWKPRGERRNLVKAGALILADIERLDRATQLPSAQKGGAV